MATAKTTETAARGDGGAASNTTRRPWRRGNRGTARPQAPAARDAVAGGLSEAAAPPSGAGADPRPAPRSGNPNPSAKPTPNPRRKHGARARPVPATPTRAETPAAGPATTTDPSATAAAAAAAAAAALDARDPRALAQALLAAARSVKTGAGRRRGSDAALLPSLRDTPRTPEAVSMLLDAVAALDAESHAGPAVDGFVRLCVRSIAARGPVVGDAGRPRLPAKELAAQRMVVRVVAVELERILDKLGGASAAQTQQACRLACNPTVTPLAGLLLPAFSRGSRAAPLQINPGDRARILRWLICADMSIRDAQAVLRACWPGVELKKTMAADELVALAIASPDPGLLGEVLTLGPEHRARALLAVDDACARALEEIAARPANRNSVFRASETLKACMRQGLRVLKRECIASGLGSASVIDGEAEAGRDSDLESSVSSATVVSTASAGGTGTTPLPPPIPNGEKLTPTLRWLYQFSFPTANFGSAPSVASLLPNYQAFSQLRAVAYLVGELAYDVKRLAQETPTRDAVQDHRLLDLLELMVKLQPGHRALGLVTAARLLHFCETAHMAAPFARRVGISDRAFSQLERGAPRRPTPLSDGPPPKSMRQASRGHAADGLVPYVLSAETDVRMVADTAALEIFAAALREASVVGLDAEWPALNIEVQLLHPDLAVSIVQFGLQTGSTQSVFLLDAVALSADAALMDRFRAVLEEFYGRSDAVTLGYGIHNDLGVLRQLFPQLPAAPRRVVDLDAPANRALLHQHVAAREAASGDSNTAGNDEPGNDADQAWRGGLSQVVKRVLNKTMDKSCQVSNWHQRPLRDDQIQYAALDVIALLDIYGHGRSSMVSWHEARQSRAR